MFLASAKSILARVETAELTPKRIWQLETGHACRAGKSDHRQLLASSPFGHVSASLSADPDSSRDRQHGAGCGNGRKWNGGGERAFREPVGSLEDAPGIGDEKAPMVPGRRPPGLRKTRSHSVLAPREKLGAYCAGS